MTQEFRTFTQRLTDEPNKTTRVFNVRAKTIVDRFGNDVVDSKGNKIWFPETFDPASAIEFGRSLASKPTVDAFLEFRRNVKQGGPWDLQRSYNGQSDVLFASRFTDAASYAYGLIGAAAGFSPTTLMAGAGAYNAWNNPKTAGLNFGNNPNNPPFISKGIRDFFDSTYGPPAIIPDNSFQENPAYAAPADRFKTAFDRPPRNASSDIDRLAAAAVGGKITPSVGFTDPSTANPYAGSFPQALDRPTSFERDGWFSSMARNGEVERIMRDRGIAPPSASGSSGSSTAFTGSGKWSSVPTDLAQPAPSDRPESFDNRFGNWGFVPAGGFGNPGSSALPNYKRSAIPDGLAPTSAQGAFPATPASQAGVAGTGGVLGEFNWDRLITAAAAAMPSAQRGPPLAPNFPGQESAFGDPSRNGSNPDGYSKLWRASLAFPGITPPDPEQPSPEGPSLPGIVSGKPMPLWSTPLPLGELLNNSKPSGNDDWFRDLAGLVSRNSTQPEPPQQAAGSMPERSLGRKTYSVSRASDPQNPDQLAPLPLDDVEEQPDLRALEAAFSGSGNIRDAVALYKARRSSRR